jgi:hypothetical protein
MYRKGNVYYLLGIFNILILLLLLSFRGRNYISEKLNNPLKSIPLIRKVRLWSKAVSIYKAKIFPLLGVGKFNTKSQIVNVSGVAGHTVSVKATHLCYSTRAAMGNM